ncbi:MAG: DUF86 domain-containing protein [Chroococcidiopsidaceae cyanobacterium CP_BM_ER_R8_30]|nr:DUF86 domain-containing protein [Chroococcidiopsidaceae cyanobacterium CP_BM_ER_R8_30]
MSLRRDQAALFDVALASQQIQRYTQGIDRTQLELNDEKQAAILYRIIVIGEATKRISQTFRERHPDIAWQEMAGMRDRITHKYDQVNLDVVWDVVQNKIPQLLAQIEPLLPAQ